MFFNQLVVLDFQSGLGWFHAPARGAVMLPMLAEHYHWSRARVAFFTRGIYDWSDSRQHTRVKNAIRVCCWRILTRYLPEIVICDQQVALVAINGLIHHQDGARQQSCKPRSYRGVTQNPG